MRSRDIEDAVVARNVRRQNRRFDVVNATSLIMARLPIGVLALLFLAIAILSDSLLESSKNKAIRSMLYLNSQDVAFLEGLSIAELTEIVHLCELPIPIEGWDPIILISRLKEINKTIDLFESDQSESVLPWLKWALTELRLGQAEAAHTLTTLVQDIMRKSYFVSASGAQHVSGLERERLKQQGCLDICNVTMHGQPGKYFEQQIKHVNCTWLWSEDMDARSIDEPAPLWEELSGLQRDGFLYGGRVTLKIWHENMDQAYLGADHDTIWDGEYIEALIEDCEMGRLHGSYGNSETELVYEGLQLLPGLKNGHVLVIG
jgi:hypothetical protein